MDIKQYVSDKLRNALSSLGVQETSVILERPKDNAHGDISTNAAMMYGKKLGKNPKEFAESIIESLNIPDEYITKASVAGPGFINLYIADKYYLSKLEEINQLKGNYGRMNDNAGKRANIEWVSANPTGPLHAGHGRNIALGKSISILLEWTGFVVTREYYYNDAGKQMNNLAKSVYARYLQETQTKEVSFPVDGYVGEYINEISYEVKKYFVLKFIRDNILLINEIIEKRTGNNLLEIDWIKNKPTVELVLQNLADKRYDRFFKEYLEEIDKENELNKIVDKILENFNEKSIYPKNNELNIENTVKDVLLKLVNEKLVNSNSFINNLGEYLYNRYSDQLEGADLQFFKDFAENECWNKIHHTLIRMDVIHDRYFSERSLYDDGSITNLIEEFRKRNFTYKANGAEFLKLTNCKDSKGKQLFEKDKVVIKSTGEPTYRLPDMAYHINKLDRNFDFIVDIFGADHGETYKEVLAGISLLEYDVSRIKVIIHQMVTFVSEGKPVKMSKRSDNVYYLDDLIDDVGVDVVQFFFVMRSANTQLEFDLALAKEQSDKNPVFYLQYAHARICSILRNALEVFPEYQAVNKINYNLLSSPEAINLMKILSVFPESVAGAAASLEPHKIITYLNEVAENYHRFYHNNRVIDAEAKELSYARLKLCEASRIVLKNGFDIIGISAPERM